MCHIETHLKKTYFWFVFGFAMMILLQPFGQEAVFAQVHRGYSIPTVDLNDKPDFHTVVAKDLDKTNQYLGHPSTVLMDDGKTIIAAFPTGHGRGELRFRRSSDGGRTWRR